MNLDELYSAGNEMRDLIWDVPADVRDKWTRDWIVALVEYQGVSPAVAYALAHRYGFNLKLKGDVEARLTGDLNDYHTDDLVELINRALEVFLTRVIKKDEDA
jgi:hypothetical protein